MYSRDLKTEDQTMKVTNQLMTCALGALLALAVPGMALAQDLLVVVPDQSPVQQLSESQVRQIFLGDISRVGGTRLAVVMYVDSNPVQENFLHRVLGLSVADFNSHWMRQVFRAGGKAPGREPGGSAVAQRVASSPGGIGVLTDQALADASGLRAVYRTAQ
ncbi:MAG: hypothetical protein OEY97_05285 [Nitrospirota bacterium]|nr:hypothetical protein [Nitrospirota bacterium]